MHDEITTPLLHQVVKYEKNIARNGFTPAE